MESEKIHIEEEDDEIDDWNPDPHAETVLKKHVIDVTNKKIKDNLQTMEQEEEENYKLFAGLDYEQMKKEAKTKQDTQKEDIAKKVEEMKKNIVRIEEIPLRKKPQGQQKQTRGKKGAKPQARPQAQERLDEEDENYSSDDDEDNIMYDLKNKISASENPFTENLYDPIQDNKYEDWVEGKLRKDKASLTVLSCPFCFMQVSYDAQRHAKYDNQYRAMFVRNCRVDASKPLKFARGGVNAPKPSEDKFEIPKQKKKPTASELASDLMEEDDDNDDNKPNDDLAQYKDDYETSNPKDFEYFFPVHCAQCETEIGVYDFEEKLYHFFSVVPSLG